MYSTSILPVELQSFEYYKNKLPLFLQNSHGFLTHFEMWYEFLTTQAENSDSLLYLFNIFDSEYLEYIRDLEGSGSTGPDDYGDKNDILDKIGAIFGVSRKFSCTYYDEDEGTVTEELSLNNQEFLILIKAQIIKNYCVGTYRQIQDYYEWAGLQMYMLNGPGQAALTIYLLSDDEHQYSNNVKKMFLSGLLTIESMGVKYDVKLVVFGDQLKWDAFGINEVWDAGVWTE